METPNSTRRVVTRSQTKAAAAAANRGNTLISASDHDPIQRKSTRSALFDISNDSPVLGLALGRSFKKSGGRGPRFRTPGSGESLLRGQVKILLKKKKEEEDQQQQYFLGYNGQLAMSSISGDGDGGGGGGGLLAPPTPAT